MAGEHSVRFGRGVLGVRRGRLVDYVRRTFWRDVWCGLHTGCPPGHMLARGSNGRSGVMWRLLAFRASCLVCVDCSEGMP